jgi:hypothetical protein
MQDMEEQRVGPAWCSGYEAKKKEETSLWAVAIFTTICANAQMAPRLTPRMI